MKKSSVDNMFKGSGTYTEAGCNVAHTLLCDEAHRLNEKSGMFHNQGENQIKEIIHAAYCSVFFIDESQRVTMDDIGSVEEMRDLIIERNRVANRARVLAGYCWEWNKKEQNNTDYHDIKIGNFEMSWNLGSGEPFAVSETSINEAGCIHTSQGLEFDYVGVIMGDDIRFENGHVITDFTKRAKTDQSLKGIKKLYKESPDEAVQRADEIIKNTYCTLLTRGMKGCYIYCTDANMAAYLKKRLEHRV